MGGNNVQQELQVAKTTTTDLAEPLNIPIVDGLDTLAESDFVVPFVRLTQALSKDVVDGEARPGEFRNSMTGEKYPDVLEFAVLRVGVRRDYFDENRKRVCFSSDAITGIGTPGGNCATCELAKWGRERGAADPSEPPKCDRGVEYIALIPGAEDALPVAITLSSTNSKEARKVNSLLRMMRTPHTFEARAVKRESPKGTFFGWEVKKGRPLSPEELHDYLEMRQMLAGVNIVVDHPDEGEQAGPIDDAVDPEDAF